MTPNKKRLRRCHEGKKPYGSLDEARSAAVGLARMMQKKGDPIVRFIRAYGCSCGSFHIGRTRDINWELLKALDAERFPLRRDAGAAGTPRGA